MATTHTNNKITALQGTAMAGALALGSYAIYSFTKKSDFKIRIDKHGKESMITTAANSDIIRSRISQTYKYLFGSIITTGATSYALYKIGFAQTILNNPRPWMFVSFLTSITTMLLTKFTNYKTNYKSKHLYWTLFNISMGSSLSVLGYVGSTIITQSLIYTSTLMGGISLIAMSAPNNYFLGLGSVLSVGLGLLNGFSIIQWFYPNTDMTNLTVPFSLGLFGLYTAYDTQKVLYNAQDMSEGNIYDPINQQLELYLDSVNLFVDIVQLLIKLQKEEDDDEKKKKKKKNQGN